MNGVLRDTLGRITNSIQLNADRYGNLLTARDPTVWYAFTNTSTNVPTGAPFADLSTFTNVSNGQDIPLLCALQVFNADGYPVDFKFQPFFLPPTNGTYAAGTAITNWGLDKQYLISAFTQNKATNTYGISWETNANIVELIAEPLYHDIPSSGTNLQFLIINKGATCLFTNGITFKFGFRK